MNVQVNDVYMFMGRELEALDEIPAGNILGVCASCLCAVMIIYHMWTARCNM